ncbi:hypothetical protein [Pseudomonas sp.]|uniref:hypothetical protein n=1 Tax=Pseudomonas sp. TaxID=306 RepID=UPI002735ACC2|nr:hypothetical protein [Pseudomonas sp.]MDP3816207.1 hypothetical protein [Pseudomonas sp.]
MPIANVIPLSAQVAADLARQHAMPACTVLTPELANSLQLVNAMTRRLRDVGVRVEAASPLDVTLFIVAEDAGRLAEAFRAEWRGASWSTKGTRTLNSVRLGGCRICWLTPVKEQDS